MKTILSILSLSATALIVTSCATPEFAANNYGAPSSLAKSNRSSMKNSVSSKSRMLIKSGNMNLEVSNVAESAQKVETTVSEYGGYITSLSERDDSHKSASYSIRVPARKLVSLMDDFSTLGEVTYKKINVTDVTASKVAFEVELMSLRSRKSRMQALLRAATSIKDKLEIEKQISSIEKEIFLLERSVKEHSKHSQYSKLELYLSRKSIKGPIGAVWDGFTWSFGKLFTIRD